MRIRKLAVATVWISAACYGAGPKLAVVIFDYAGTPGATLKAAAETAREDFRTAGVETEWSVCRVPRDLYEHCALLPAGAIRVNVIPRDLEGALKSGESLGCAMMCPGCMIAYAFYQPVEALAGSADGSVSTTLAVVMAHEVGHLLGMLHSPSGIMKALLTRRDIRDAQMGRMRFTEGEAKLQAAAERETSLLVAVN